MLSSRQRSRPPAPIRILLVDDDADLLFGMRNALRRFPIEVHLANSAEDGFALLASREIDAVVTDERMPSMSGSEFLALVCERHPDTVRLMLSGGGGPMAGDRAFEEGEVAGYIQKPCSAAQLIAAVRHALARRRQRSAAIGTQPRGETIDASVAEREAERRIICETLRESHGDPRLAARALQTDYETLRLRIADLGIRAEDYAR